MKLSETTLLTFSSVMVTSEDNKKIVDSIWLKDPLKYMNAAKQRKLYDHPYIRCTNSEEQEYSRRLLGIMCFNDGKEDYTELYEFLKRSCRSAYDYYISHDEMNMVDFTESILFDNSIPGEENMIAVVKTIMLMAEIDGKEVQGMTLGIDDLKANTIDKVVSRFHKRKFANTTKDKQMAVRKLEDQLYEKYGVIQHYDDLESIAKEHNMKDYFHLFENTELVPSKMFYDYIIEQEDVRNILLSYIKSLRPVNDLHAAMEYLINQAVMLLILKEYIWTKDFGAQLTIVKEDVIREVATVGRSYEYERELEEANAEILSLQKERARILKELDLEKKKLEEANKEILSLQREKTKLLKELEQINENKEELQALRELLFEQKSEEYDDDDDECLNFNVLKSVRGVVVGGRRKWQQKLKKNLPNFIFIDTDALNFDTKVLDGTDTVFVHTNYISHGLYYKIVGAAEKRGIKIQFLNEQNERLALKKICEVYDGKVS